MLRAVHSPQTSAANAVANAARRHRRARCPRRAYSTETVTSSSSSSTSQDPPPSLNANRSSTQRNRPPLHPSPRSPSSSTSLSGAFPHLPPNFGRNQLLPIPNSKRALLENVVGQFNAPIRYAFAYGSGVFEQDGYAEEKKKPMLDFLFAVSHPGHWHSINMAQFPSHYPIHARMLGSDFVSRVQEVTPGIWFNAYVQVNGVDIKYGVTSVDNLCRDLLSWDTLYLAGRMHKPLRIIKDDARVRLTQQVNLTSALRTALLTLPPTFTEIDLFNRITGFSYHGDLRLLLPAENRSKISNIVGKQQPQFHELYHRLALGLPGVSWRHGSELVEQDDSPHARAALVRKLPATLLRRVTSHYQGRGPSKEADEMAFWIRVGSDPNLPDVLLKEMRSVVRYSSTLQSAKGVVSNGVGKSFTYVSAKVGKWWKGRGGSSNSSSGSNTDKTSSSSSS